MGDFRIRQSSVVDPEVIKLPLEISVSGIKRSSLAYAEGGHLLMQRHGRFGQQHGTRLQDSVHIEFEGLGGISESNDHVMPLIVVDRTGVSQFDAPRTLGDLCAQNTVIE